MIDRAILGLILVGVLALGATWVYKNIKETGRQEVREELQNATEEATAKREGEISAELRSNALKNIRSVENYEQKLQDQAASYDKRIAAINAAGGLRIAANRSQRPTASAEATSAGPSDEASSVRLPQSVEIDLYAFARKADEVRLQLGACQSWIRDNGFYGK